MRPPVPKPKPNINKKSRKIAQDFELEKETVFERLVRRGHEGKQRLERKLSQEREREDEGNFRPQINNTSRDASRERADKEPKAAHGNVGERLYFEGLKSIINKKLKTVEEAEAE